MHGKHLCVLLSYIPIRWQPHVEESASFSELSLRFSNISRFFIQYYEKHSYITDARELLLATMYFVLQNIN